jgi:glucose/arabinose dehydrogenase
MSPPPSLRHSRGPLGLTSLLVLTALAVSCKPRERAAPVPDSTATAKRADSVAIQLPPGFAISLFADRIGFARHVVVAPNGDVYVNTWRSPYDTSKIVPAGGYVVALRDTNQDGRADLIERFGPTRESGSHGGTGIALANGVLYVESDSSILRFALAPNQLAPGAAAEVLLTGLTTIGEHPQHSVAVDTAGHLFVTVGSATNSCQVKNRVPESPGERPCRELATRAGVWRYSATRTGQHFGPRERYATGLRNAVGIAVNPVDGQVYATVHGRDDLWGNWPKLYTAHQGAELPAETLVRLVQGGDYGWPYCYFDPTIGKLVLAPEYGGDGKKIGDCDKRTPPVAAFPAHWAPDGLTWYAATGFPAEYRGGAFIAFHGSWNRAPEPQGGYNVVLQPFANGKPAGDFTVFADGFAGPDKQPNTAQYRPVGVAVSPDGALYVTDDQTGTVWKVVYRALAVSHQP